MKLDAGQIRKNDKMKKRQNDTKTTPKCRENDINRQKMPKHVKKPKIAKNLI